MGQSVARVSVLSGTNHELAEEGSYFVAKTVVAGVATIAALTSLADASPFLLAKTPAASAGGRRVRFDYLRLTCLAAGTGGTQINFAARVDATKADPTGGSSLTPVSVNMGAPNPSSLETFFAGALAAAAASGAMREVCAIPLMRPVIPVVGDQYLIKFGGSDQGIGNAPGGAAAAALYFGGPPIIIDPAQVCAFHIWLPGQSAAGTYAAELGYWAR